MRLVLLALAGIACGVLAASAAYARDIYVSNAAGDDRFKGVHPTNEIPHAGPVRTIANGLRLAAPGDRVVVENTGRAYRESVSLVGPNNSASAVEEFILEGNGAALEGAEPVRHEAWMHISGDTFRHAPERLGFQQLFLSGKPALQRHLASPESLPPLAPREWCLARGYIYFRVDAGRTPQSYRPSTATRQTGITLYKVRGAVVRNFVLQGFQLDGINAHDGAMGVRLEGLTCRGNGRSGISVGGSSRVLVTDCLVGDNGRAQLRTEGFSKTHVEHCDLLDNSAPAQRVEGGQLWIDGKPIARPAL